jgi:hypothetical protein
MINAKIHSKLPERSSERPFAEKLLTLEFPDNNRPHLWFAQLPGLKDIDAIIWLPRTGLFIVEMKSWPISVIKDISLENFEIEPWVKHSTKKSPWEQVQEAEQQFRGRLSGDPDTRRKLGNPWISPVVALYHISRDDFESKIEGETGSKSEIDYKRLLAQGTIFREDLDSGEAFIKRLGICRQNPIIGDRPKSDLRGVNSIEEAVKALDTFITPHLRAGRHTPAYDKARIQELEKDSAKRLKTISWGNPVFCTGYAGTGKTLLGLQAALLRLEAAPDRLPAIGAGLFVCFNKVLAADIKRLTALSHRFLDIKFDVYDIFELLRVIAGRLKIDVSSNTNDADGWAKEILAEIVKRKDANANAKKLFESWGLIVVDEAQDLADWAWDFLDALSEHSNNLFVIDGKNQLLYRNERAKHLETVYELTHESQDKANFIEQRRVFRTTDTTFLISQLFMLTYPDLKAAEKKWEEHLKPAHEKAKKVADKRDARQSPLFDFDIELSRRGGYAHKLAPLPPVVLPT